MILEQDQSEDIIVYIADNADHEMELKQVLKKRLDVSSRLLSKLKRSKNIFVNDEHVRYHEIVKVGDTIKIIMEEDPNYFLPQEIPFEVAYEDVDVLIVNKQPGIVTHPTRSHPDNTIANAASWYLKNRGKDCKIRFVNRLDMYTSGLLIIAKNSYSHHVLSEQMQADKVEKKYVAFVWGRVEDDNGRIEAAIYKPSEESIKRVVDEKGQDSITEYKVIERYNDATMLEVKLLTGRTHQIRVHMEHIGHPMIGDSLYGREDDYIIDRQALHAKYLYFLQPRYKKEVEVEAHLPEDLELLRQKLLKM